MNTINGVKWRRFIAPKKVEQINDQLFIDTYINVTQTVYTVFIGMHGAIWHTHTYINTDISFIFYHACLRNRRILFSPVTI